VSGVARLFKQAVTVQTRTGAGAYGDVYADPTSVACFISEQQRLVRDQNAVEVVSSTMLYAPLTAAPTEPPAGGQFTPGSRVVVNGRTAFVISAARQDSAGPARIHHTEVHLT
jgi:hypothetical protein